MKREGVWGREGLAAAADRRLADDGKRFHALGVVSSLRSKKISLERGGVWGGSANCRARFEGGG